MGEGLGAFNGPKMLMHTEKSSERFRDMKRSDRQTDTFTDTDADTDTDTDRDAQNAKSVAVCVERFRDAF